MINELNLTSSEKANISLGRFKEAADQICRQTWKQVCRDIYHSTTYDLSGSQELSVGCVNSLLEVAYVYVAAVITMYNSNNNSDDDDESNNNKKTATTTINRQQQQNDNTKNQISFSGDS